MSVDGQELGVLYSPLSVRQAEQAAKLSLEEIAVDQASIPTVKKRYRLCLSIPQREGRTLSHKIITASEDAKLLQLVTVRDEPLGYVECAAVLKERLHQYAYTNLPEHANGCFLTYAISMQPLYSRAQKQCSYEEMLNLIFDVSPIIYVNE